LNSPPHPERRRINEFASHNLTLRSQLSNSGSTLFRRLQTVTRANHSFAAHHLPRTAQQTMHQPKILRGSHE
jgi:hypothetical protein